MITVNNVLSSNRNDCGLGIILLSFHLYHNSFSKKNYKIGKKPLHLFINAFMDLKCRHKAVKPGGPHVAWAYSRG